jgi:hypothetical protein
LNTNTIKFPGAYKATDPYANFSIYNGRKAFPMPGPAVWKGGAGSGTSPAPAASAKAEASTAPAAPEPATSAPATPEPATSAPASPEPATSAPVAAPVPTTMSTVRVPAAAPTKPADQAGCAALYGQCGGQGFTGAACCSAGTCKEANPWYSQCIN